MPGMLTIDARATFAAMIAMSVTPKLKFGTTEPDISPAGERKHVAELAVTYVTEPGMRAVSEVISVTITGGDMNLPTQISPGTPVELERVRCGVSAPEQRPDGRGVRGGRLYFTAAGIRPAGALRQVKEAS